MNFPVARVCSELEPQANRVVNLCCSYCLPEERWRQRNSICKQSTTNDVYGI
jgi:hypothetical protein